MRQQKHKQNRRDFLRNTFMTSLGAGIASVSPSQAWGMSCPTVDLPKTLVNVMLQGGADFRYLFMPAPNHANSIYTDLIWQARRSLYDSSYSNYEEMFANEYLLTTEAAKGLSFGIHKTAQWLHMQFTQGSAAIIANAHCSQNRRHDQSILNADAGQPGLEVLNFDRSGWGGRLVEYLDGSANSVELGESVSTFNKGSLQGQRLKRVVHAQDLRDIALAATDENSPASRRNILARALNAYYQGRRPEISVNKPANWPYKTAFEHHDALLEAGNRIKKELDQCLPLPESLRNLSLASSEFAQQCRNLYDVCQVPEALGLGIVSMSYGGWDTHNNQAQEIESNLSDIFGADAGLSVAMNEITQLPYLEKPANEQLVFYFASDFGRQLVANGASGTDHGRGTYSLMIGESVRGGVYGEMFPDGEAQADKDGLVPLNTPGADIEGLTSTDRILSVAADWVKPGAGEFVFPDARSAGNEASVDLNLLLRV